jgi:hypothetical protein
MTGCTYDHKRRKKKIIIIQDVLLRTPITQMRRHITVFKMKNKR